MDKQTKPVMAGLDFIRGNGWTPRQYTLAGAKRLARKLAGASCMPGASGLVIDCGEHYRVTVAAPR
jgi:hypothetical protein